MLCNWCENLKTRFKVLLGPALMSECLFAAITVSKVETLGMACHTTSFLSDPKTLNHALAIQVAVLANLNEAVIASFLLCKSEVSGNICS